MHRGVTTQAPAMQEYSLAFVSPPRMEHSCPNPDLEARVKELRSRSDRPTGAWAPRRAPGAPRGGGVALVLSDVP
eukprot:6249404-Alexandrium_andersonii.AAC.1